jgi:hypothetical protein
VACRSEFVTADAAGGVRVFPLDRSSIGGVGVDVAAELASQIGNRSEDAARDDVAFDLGEPEFDLVEPGRVSGRKVKPNSRMVLDELADRLSFVGGEVVEDDVNLLPRRAQGYNLLQKGDELATGVAGGGFAVDAAGGGIERCILRRACRAGTRSRAVRRVPAKAAGRDRDDPKLEWRSSHRRRTERLREHMKSDRMLTWVDDCTRECQVIEVDTSLGAVCEYLCVGSAGGGTNPANDGSGRSV